MPGHLAERVVGQRGGEELIEEDAEAVDVGPHQGGEVAADERAADHFGGRVQDGAAVVPGPDARFGEVPVAFVVPDSVGRPSSGELAGHLHVTGLARQKMPVAWHFVDSLPMTPSGKVKKFELLAIAEAERAAGRG